MTTTKLLALTLALAPLPALANIEDENTVCFALGDLARIIMESRQAGVTIDRALEIAAKGEPPFSDIARGLVIKAYNHPIYTVPEIIESAASKFRTSAVVKCLSIVREGKDQ